ncbi:MAG: DUF3836 domain-containing protein [Bacteroidales bacterium]|jgi:hypothetical protein|nr:DUF3836 domain-containing protein [Bacteroidales bacterium]
MRKIHFILSALILTGCTQNSWWEPRTIITSDQTGQAVGRFQFTYDERGNKFTETGDTWSSETKTWLRDYRISYSYDIYGIRTGALREKRDDLTGKWVPASRIICGYSPETSRPETETHQIYHSDTSLWEDSFRDHYIHDEQGRLLYIVREKWNNGEFERDVVLRGKFLLKAHIVTPVTGWVNFIRDSFIYDQDGILTGGQVDRWNHVTGAWNPVFRYAYTYDRKGNAISETEEKWDPQSGSWSEVGQYAYTYDNHGNTIESQYIPATAVPDAEYFLVFYYNNMQSSVGYYIGDTGTFPGANGTAEYFRLKR